MTPRLNRFWVILCGVLCLIATGPIRAQQPAFLTNGLVAYYPFNGNARDESGNGFDGLQISSSLTADRFLVANEAIKFINNVNSRVELNNTGSLELGDSFTVSVWAKFNEGWTYHAEDLIHTMGGKPNWSGWSLSIGNDSFTDPDADVEIIWQVWKNGVWGRAVPRIGFRKLRVWNHFTGVRSKEGLSLYLNGLRIAHSPTTVIPPTQIITIGGSFHPVSGAYERDVDDVRIYNRALSEAEVKALYDFESQPAGLNPRLATATVQVVNGFVIGATVTDGGGGYTNTPVVTISGGGGSGATARASISNGVVTAVSILTAGTGYTSVPTLTIAAPPFPPRRAKGASQVINGFVVGATVLDGGFGYTEPPDVLLVGGGGTGATATAVVQNGVVTGILLVHSGSGYTAAPTVRIASPPFAPSVGIEVSRVRVNLRVVQGRKYQLESSADLQAWVPAGAPFVAQDEDLQQEFDSGSAGTYFRVQQVP